MKLPRIRRPRPAADENGAGTESATLSGRRRPSPGTLADTAHVAGLACLDGAAWWLQPVAGLVVLGLVLLLIGWVVDE